MLLLGLGMGTAFMPAMSLATHGVEPRDAGVASAMVNTSQQVGGAIGTALLNTIAASATDRLPRRRTSAGAGPGAASCSRRRAMVHGYTSADLVRRRHRGGRRAIALTLINAGRPGTAKVASSDDADATSASEQESVPVVLH